MLIEYRGMCTIDVCCIYIEAARIINEICLALEFLHTNDIAHRDLKVRKLQLACCENFCLLIALYIYSLCILADDSHDALETVFAQ